MKLKRNVPMAEEEKRKKRKEWPLGDMKVGDILEVEKRDEWDEASKYAHAFASRKSWKMRTTWIIEENIGRIRRMK
jgi:hypothetical protein